MKKFSLAALLLSFLFFAQSCSKSTKSNSCPAPITNALGVYINAPTQSTIILDAFTDILDQNPIGIEVRNSNSCDFVEVKLTGALTATFRAKFNIAIPVQGDYFTIADGQTFTYNGVVYRANSGSNSMFIRDASSMMFSVIATDASGSSIIQILLTASK